MPRPASRAEYVLAAVDGAKHVQTLEALQVLTFPHDDLEPTDSGWWWLVHHEGEAVAFAGMRQAGTDAAAAYLSRCGVLSGHRGFGLQRRLLGARLTRARREGFQRVITTTYLNTPSANNLIRSGFRLYDPESPWGSIGTNYWTREVHTS